MRYTRVHNHLWDDDKFKALRAEGKLAFLYLLSCKHSNIIGLYCLPSEYAQADLGMSSEMITGVFSEMLRLEMIGYDPSTKVIFVKNKLKYQPIENKNQAKAAVENLRVLPQTVLIKSFSDRLRGLDPRSFSWICSILSDLKGSVGSEGLPKGLLEGFGEGFANPVTVTVPVTVKKLSSFMSSREPARRILAFLNEKTGRNYQAVKANLEMIESRIREGATEEQLMQVVAKKTREWLTDEKMNYYLRPATLFNRMKFAQYQGELVAEERR